MADKKDYRLRILWHSNRYYLVRHNNKVWLMNGQEDPLALSYIFGQNAAEVRFQLEDAYGGGAAEALVKKHLPNCTIDLL